MIDSFFKEKFCAVFSAKITNFNKNIYNIFPAKSQIFEDCLVKNYFLKIFAVGKFLNWILSKRLHDNKYWTFYQKDCPFVYILFSHLLEEWHNSKNALFELAISILSTIRIIFLSNKCLYPCLVLHRKFSIDIWCTYFEDLKFKFETEFFKM